MNYCYGKGVQKCVLCWEFVPFLEGLLSGVLPVLLLLDVNECEIGICGNYSSCSNTEGSYNCSCHEGYELIGSNLCAGIINTVEPYTP